MPTISEQWRGDFQLTADSTALTIQPGSSATSTITVTPQDGFNGNVSLTCSVSSDLVGVTCAVPATPVNASGTTTVTISAGNTSRTVPLLQRFPKLPPVSRRLPFVVFVPATLLASLLAFRRQRASHTRLAYACSSAVLVAIALGFGQLRRRQFPPPERLWEQQPGPEQALAREQVQEREPARGQLVWEQVR